MSVARSAYARCDVREIHQHGRPRRTERSFPRPLEADTGTRRYNIAPTEEVLAIAAPKGEPEAMLMRWGLIPSWSTDLSSAAKMINARMESVTERPAFRRLVPKASRRALQLADGYFEWLKPERRSEPRQPFYFQLDGGEPSPSPRSGRPPGWRGVAAQHRAADLRLRAQPRRRGHPQPHARDPPRPRVPDGWLDPTLGAEEALALCGPLPAERLSARPANPLVNKAGGAEEGRSC